jgi:hypothetical protein
MKVNKSSEEEAIDLLNSFFHVTISHADQVQCAIIAADLAIRLTGGRYWYDVKTELEKYNEEK